MKRPGTVLLIVTALWAAASAVDGILITGSKQKYMDVGGNKLVAYTLQNNAVSGSSRTIAQAAIQSQPAVNPSGTHVAFLRTLNSATWLSAVPIDGGTIVDVIQIASQSQYGDVWWLTNGNIAVYFNCELHKVSFKDGASRTEITRAAYARFMCSPQGYYIGVSGAGDKVSWRIYKEACFGYTCGSTQLRGTIPAMTSTTPPSIGEGVSTFVGACGCGNAVSPSGAWTACLQGSGHEGIGVHRWESNQSGYYNLPFTKLQQWAGVYVGIGGDANRWAVNSDAWLTTIAGIPDRFMSQGSDIVVFPIDTTRKTAINVTNNKNAASSTWSFVASFWVSTRAEVNSDLVHYVDQREAWRAYWEKALRGQTAQRPATGVMPSGPDLRRNAPRDWARAGGSDAVGLYDQQGRAITYAAIAGGNSAAMLKNGIYLVRTEGRRNCARSVFVR